ncbi:protein-glutamate methylesterase/protein-glutamine glutaminase [Vallitalea okinawensis]|uniref:protein-glutamate methylesterase/protein-glutamine glutaminase n=1 Tax=Vallitalea okinawensis TaxID=2078660 RepID=UPI000CFDAD82|nr:chemotaxis response regulator protein-glutamate methylesterase [Vallitalea okinawensis]
MTEKIKVVVVDDSAFMRKILSDLIMSDGRCDVIGKASNGLEAIEVIKNNKPDVITVDVEMPKMNGIEMLKELYKTDKIPAIMISSITTEGAKETLEALSLGAVDFITKPENIFSINSEEIKNDLISKVVTAANIPSWKIAKSQFKIQAKPIQVKQDKNLDMSVFSDHIDQLVTIGTSTGGPKALQTVISHINKGFNAPILIVQHMPKGFTASLASRLDTMSEIHVKEAEDGEILKKGVAYIAPGDKHMVIKRMSTYKYKILLDDSEKVRGHKPSCDVMMTSVANEFKHHTIDVIMTGMGADGSLGLKELTTKLKSYVIAQDKDSCVVFGMPKAAIDLGLANEVTDLKNISHILNDKIGVI